MSLSRRDYREQAVSQELVGWQHDRRGSQPRQELYSGQYINGTGSRIPRDCLTMRGEDDGTSPSIGSNQLPNSSSTKRVQARTDLVQ